MVEQQLAVGAARGARARARRDALRDVALAAFVAVPLGVLTVAVADRLGRMASPWAAPLFWAGLVTIFAPAAFLLWRDTLTRAQTLTVLLSVGIGLLVAEALRSAGMLTDYDALLHVRTLDDIVRTGQLFNHNPLLPISPYYPGLEIVTHAVMSMTGIGEIPAALAVTLVARVLLILALFLFFERVASPSRLTGMATLLYVTAPSFFAFDAAFAYETLALPLAVFCLFALRAAQSETGRRRVLLEVAGAAAALTVVVTHHVTSFILTAALLSWTALTLLTRKRPRERLPGGGWVTLLTVAALALWMTGVATATVGYLAPEAASAGREALRIMAGEGIGRRLFEAPGGGMTAPFLERATGIASVLIVLALLPLGLVYLRRHPRGNVLTRFLVAVSVSYPLLMALRFTRSGWEIGSRAMAFLYVALAFVLASGIAWLWGRGASSRPWVAPAASAVLTIAFLGGVIAGTSPVNRMARPYTPGAYDASIEGEGIAAAEWARSMLPPGERVAADSTNASLLGGFGRQYALSSADEVSLSGLFLLPWGDYQREMISRGNVEYVVVDRRIAGARAPAGFFFEKWEREVADYGKRIDPLTLSRFDELPRVQRVFDSGDIQVYDVRELQR